MCRLSWNLEAWNPQGLCRPLLGLLLILCVSFQPILTRAWATFIRQASSQANDTCRQKFCTTVTEKVWMCAQDCLGEDTVKTWTVLNGNFWFLKGRGICWLIWATVTWSSRLTFPEVSDCLTHQITWRSGQILPANVILFQNVV